MSEKKFGIKDGQQNSYEEFMEGVIEKNMAKQNRIKKVNGGSIAKGCGAVMEQKRKGTTCS